MLTFTRTQKHTFHLHLETNPPSSILKGVRERSRWLHFVYISLELDHDLLRGCCRALTAGLSYRSADKQKPSKTASPSLQQRLRSRADMHADWKSRKKKENLEGKAQGEGRVPWCL